jgi:hypothetical protein
LATVAVFLAATACGKSTDPGTPPPAAATNPLPLPTLTAPPPPVAASPPEVANGTAMTQFQRRRLLGHYSTLDGTTGFILDRTVSPWRAKLDGNATSVPVYEDNTPRPGIKEYRSDDRKMWLRIDVESGHIELFQGPKQRQAVDVVRDADADPLR